METERPDLDRLLEHAGWARALGVQLAGASDADDLLQEAWVHSLQSGGTVRRPGAWLAGVVRHLAARGRRTEARRVRRERAASRPEAQPGPDELLAEAELSRVLIRTVTELDEPFRSTVLLRFYRGLTSEEIASAQGVPAATVRTRLHRALARLRERLDREHGGRERWALVFAGPAIATGAPGEASGGPLLVGKLALGAATLAAAWIGIATWQGWSRSEVGRGEPALAVAGDEAPSSPAQPLSAPPGVRREAPLAAPAIVADEVLLLGTVTGPDGRAVELEGLTVVDADGASRSAQVSVPGAWSIAGLAAGTFRLSASAKGFLPATFVVELDGSQAVERRDLVLQPGRRLPVWIVDADGARWGEGPEKGRRRQVAIAVQREGLEGGAGFRGVPDTRLGEYEALEHPGPDDPSGFLTLCGTPPLLVRAVLGDLVLDSRPVTADTEEVVLTIDRAAMVARFGGVEVRFLDGTTGEPLAGALAALSDPSIYPGGGQPAADHAFRFESLPPGWYRLQLYHPTHVAAPRWVRVPEGRVATLADVPAFPRRQLRGRVLDAAGDPTHAAIRWYPLDELRGPEDVEIGVTHGTFRGGFEFPVGAAARIRLVFGSGDHALHVVDVDPAGADAQDLVVPLERGVPVTLRLPEALAGSDVTLADASGVPIQRWWVRRELRTRLEPGPVRFWIGHGDRVEVEHSFVVGDTPLVIDLGAAEAESLLPPSDAESPILAVHGRLQAPPPSALRTDPPAVWLTGADGTRHWLRSLRDDRYSFAGLTPGRWTLHWGGSSGLRESTEVLELTVAEPVVRRDLSLERAPVVAVRVSTPEGRALSAVLRERATRNLRTRFPVAVATRELPGPTIDDARNVDERVIGAGRFDTYGTLMESAPEDAIGVLVLVEDPPVHVSLLAGTQVLATQRVEPGQEEVHFVLGADAVLEQEIQVTLRAVDAESGEPLEGFVLLDDEIQGSLKDGAWSASLPPARRTLTLEARGHERTRIELDAQPGAPIDLGELRVPRGRTVRGRLVDPEGRPVEGDLALGRRENGRLRFEEGHTWFRTDGEGGFAISGLGAGDYALRVDPEFEARRADGRLLVSALVPFSTRGGSVEDLVIQAVPAVRLATGSLGTLPDGGLFQALDASGDPLLWGSVEPDLPGWLELPPGTAVLTLHDREWHEVARHRLTLDAERGELVVMP